MLSMAEKNRLGRDAIMRVLKSRGHKSRGHEATPYGVVGILMNNKYKLWVKAQVPYKIHSAFTIAEEKLSYLSIYDGVVFVSLKSSGEGLEVGSVYAYSSAEARQAMSGPVETKHAKGEAFRTFRYITVDKSKFLGCDTQLGMELGISEVATSMVFTVPDISSNQVSVPSSASSPSTWFLI